MFGAGFIQDMNNRINQNRKLSHSRKKTFKEDNLPTIYSEEEKNSFDFKKLKDLPHKNDPEVLERIKANLQKERKRQNLFFFSIGLLVLILSVLLFSIF